LLIARHIEELTIIIYVTNLLHSNCHAFEFEIRFHL